MKCNCEKCRGKEIKGAKASGEFKASGEMIISMEGPSDVLDVVIVALMDVYMKEAGGLSISATMTRWTELLTEKRVYDATMEAIKEYSHEKEEK